MIEWFKNIFRSRIGPHDVVMQGPAEMVSFFGMEGDTYLENAFVTVFASGIVFIQCEQETSTIHITGVQIIWSYKKETDDGEPKDNIRTLKPKKDK